MRYVLECNCSGYTASQSRCCHREVITAKRAKAFKDIGVIRFSDGTHMSVNVRPAKFRERIVEIIGYSDRILRTVAECFKFRLKGVSPR